MYRGQFKCNRSLCGVPVIVCENCKIPATSNPEQLLCELCREGYRNPTTAPDLVAEKRKAEEIFDKQQEDERQGSTKEREDRERKRRRIEERSYFDDRIFLRRLPLTVTLTKIRQALASGISGGGGTSSEFVRGCQWLVDRDHEAFYGSCILQMSDEQTTKQVIKLSKSPGGIRIDKKKVKVALVFRKDDTGNKVSKNVANPAFGQQEYPPLGKVVSAS